MADEIKLDYGMAETMSSIFGQGVEELQDVMQEMQNIANTLEGGVLVGRGGQAMTDAIRGSLAPSMTKLIAKFQELQGDVDAAIAAMRQADASARGQFGS
jgi:WXG100 family type VII secretion target